MRDFIDTIHTTVFIWNINIYRYIYINYDNYNELKIFNIYL